MKTLLSLTALCITLTALLGCGAGKQSPPTITPLPGIESWPATRQTDNGSFTVTLNPTEGTIERGPHFSLDVQLQPGAATDALTSIRVDADMPAHRHGMNTQPEIVRISENQHRVDGMRFHMGGDWVITVEISGESGSGTAIFPVHVE